MVAPNKDAVLNLLSAWFVFSVGLIDGLVYVSDPTPLR